MTLETSEVSDETVLISQRFIKISNARNGAILSSARVRLLVVERFLKGFTAISALKLQFFGGGVVLRMVIRGTAQIKIAIQWNLNVGFRVRKICTALISSIFQSISVVNESVRQEWR